MYRYVQCDQGFCGGHSERADHHQLHINVSIAARALGLEPTAALHRDLIPRQGLTINKTNARVFHSSLVHFGSKGIWSCVFGRKPTKHTATGWPIAERHRRSPSPQIWSLSG